MTDPMVTREIPHWLVRLMWATCLLSNVVGWWLDGLVGCLAVGGVGLAFATLGLLFGLEAAATVHHGGKIRIPWW